MSTTSLSNPLTELIPAKRRKRVYAYFALLGLMIGAVTVGVAAVTQETPMWLIVTSVVYNFLSIPFGALAASNVQEAS